MDIMSKNQMENPKKQPPNGNWHQGKTIGRCMEEMFTRGLWTDVEFQCKDHDIKGNVKAHKIVLAARSPVFEAMFFGPCADGKRVVEMKHIDSFVFLAFLRYMYSDTVNLKEEIVFYLMEIAHLYQVDCLVELCAEFLCTILSTANACEFLTHALQYELENLRNIACSFIDNNTEVLKSDSFLNLSETGLMHILKGDTFYSKEEDIIEAADTWSRKRLQEQGLEASGTNIRKCLGQAFFQLRIPTLTNKSLLEVISRKGYYTVEEYSDIAAFINNVDGITVLTNSCHKRVPELERVTINRVRCEELICDEFLMSFELSLNKDVALKSITFPTMKPYLKEMNNLYTKTTKRQCALAPEDSTIPWKCYKNKIIEIRSEEKLKRDFDPYEKNVSLAEKYNINLLQVEAYKGNLLPINMNFTLSGSIEIETLNLRSYFDLNQKQHVEDTVNFNPPLVLKKNVSRLLVTVKLRYKGDNSIQVQTKGCRGDIHCINEDGSIQIFQRSKRYNELLNRISSFEFLNFSNREGNDDSKMSRVDTE